MESPLPCRYPHIYTNLKKRLSQNHDSRLEKVAEKLESFRKVRQWTIKYQKIGKKIPQSVLMGINSVSLAAMLRADAPITKAQIFSNGMKLVRENTTGFDKPTPGKRKEIKELSNASLFRLAFLVANSPVSYKSLLTLTFSKTYPTSGLTVKKMLNHFILALKRKRGEFSYVWFLEFQERGAPHIHMLTTLPEPNLDGRGEFARIWAKVLSGKSGPYSGKATTEIIRERESLIRQHRRVKNWENIRKENGAKFYVLKYASKPEQKEVPEQFQDVGRFWGCSRDNKPEMVEEIDITEEEIRAYFDSKGLAVAKREILPKLIIDLK